MPSGDAKGRCPDCGHAISFNRMLEIVRCPWCGQVFPPEYLQPMRPPLPKVRSSYIGEYGRVIEFEGDPVADKPAVEADDGSGSGNTFGALILIVLAILAVFALCIGFAAFIIYVTLASLS